MDQLVNAGNTRTNSSGLVDVSVPLLLLSTVPLLSIALLSWHLQLKLVSPIVIGTFRTFVQLTILGLILQPIFDLGQDKWWLVFGYIFLMVLMASYEAANRSKYYFKGMYYCVLLSILANMAIVSLFAFGILIRPTPIWDPQYLIPITGMLLGNSITGAGLSLNSMLASLVEQQNEIELYLSFGASIYEASAGRIRAALHTGTMPLLNSMSIIGLVSIPGMMTGQILGGSPVMEAARYQMLIMYLIGASSFGTILTELWIVLHIGFDSSCTLRNERIIKRIEKISFLGSIIFYFYKSRKLPVGSMDETTAFVQNGNSNNAYVAPKGQLEVRSLKANVSSDSSHEPLLEISNIQRSFAGAGALFRNISFQVAAGEIVLVSGPSGVGKSQLLRAVAGLSPIDEGTLKLESKRRNDFFDPTEWRKQVRYVPQHKVDVPGTPRDFIHKVTSFVSWRKNSPAPMLNDMLSTASELIQAWGLKASFLDKEWATLSGGEAQRILVAIALASRPKALLFDEATSALDMESKLRVERSVDDFCEKFGMSVVWITHDQEQATRMGESKM